MPNPSIALVTGASRGIGRCVAETLVAQGRRVIACGRDTEALTSLCRQHSGKMWPLVCDLSQPGAATNCFDQAIALAGHLDEFVSSAGIVRYQSLGEIDEASLRIQHEVNFVAPFLLAQLVGMQMRARGAGSMVFVASTLASHPAPATAAYATSKAALITAARSLALEFAPQVRVNALAPGVVDTDMVRAPRPGQNSTSWPEQRALLQSLHPLGRLGTPEDVTQAVLFLLTAPWATGTLLTLDGGLTLK